MVNTQIDFTAALIGYPLLHGAALIAQDPKRDLRRRFLLANKLVGGLNSILDCSLAFREVTSPRWQHDNLITTKSESANAVVAVEAAYLVQGGSV